MIWKVVQPRRGRNALASLIEYVANPSIDAKTDTLGKVERLAGLWVMNGGGAGGAPSIV